MATERLTRDQMERANQLAERIIERERAKVASLTELLAEWLEEPIEWEHAQLRYKVAQIDVTLYERTAHVLGRETAPTEVSAVSPA